MSANTSIKEGGAPRSFGPVAALLVQGDEGKYFLWVPESERQLDTLSVTENGIYQAKKLGVYGWRSVSVNVATSGSVTGKDPETGQEVTVTTDPDTGEIVKTVVPVEIKVITPPTNPYGVYVDGQTISTGGMVVKAYDAEGNEMLTVPLGQITINPTVAVYDESKDRHDEYTDGEGINARRVYFDMPINVVAYGTMYRGFEFQSNQYVLVSTAQGSAYVTRYTKTGDYMPTFYRRSAGENSLTLFEVVQDATNPSKYYIARRNIDVPHNRWSGQIAGEYYSELPESTVEPIDQDVHPAGASGSPQTITVSWPRPGDGAVLETTFDILVGPHGGTGDD